MAGVKYFILFCSFLAFSAYAGESPAPTVHVQVLDPSVDASSLQEKGVVVHSAKNPPMISPSDRDKFFSQAGLANELALYDELEKDLLVEKARAYSQQKLQKKYPKLSPQKLQKLQELLFKSESKK